MLTFVLAVTPFSSGVVLSAAVSRRAVPQPSVTMGLFDGFSKAFENDDSLGAQKSAGLTKEKAKKTITWMGSGGTKKTDVIPGQKLRDIARSAGLKIKYDCNEGTCKTCEAMLDGRRVKICVSKAPAKDVTIKYNIR